ncbi:hypothetical protein ACFRH9_19540 [Peribacillus butanolivorans]|uniref:hypothetical protein n=1 Tax=Peribacillus butanolivorans TaxID=421767 RepID=UPI00366AEC92
MTDTKKMRDVYVAVADPTRRELSSLLALGRWSDKHSSHMDIEARGWNNLLTS